MTWGWGLGDPPELEHEHRDALNPDRLASGLVWLKCAVLALAIDAPFLLLTPLGAVFEWLAAGVFVVALLVSLVLVALDDDPV